MKHVWKDWNWKDWNWKDSDWKDWLLGAGKIGIALTLIYLGYVYLERWSSAPLQPNQPAKVSIHPDLYVYPPKSYVSSLESARKLAALGQGRLSLELPARRQDARTDRENCSERRARSQGECRARI